MNGEANDASENWEKLLSEIQLNGAGFQYLFELCDSEADRYDFANEILMRRMRERLVEALQSLTRTAIFTDFTFSFENKFFMTMNEQQQKTFFHSIFNLPVGHIHIGQKTDNTTASQAITISTSALLETLPQLHTGVTHLIVSNFALTRQSDVQALSNFILAKCKTLECLELERMECTVDDCNKEDNNQCDGFLDPLFHAASDLDWFSVSTKARSVYSTLVSPTALRALIVEGEQFEGLRLCGLGLTDSHVLAIVDALSTPGTHLNMLDLAPGNHLSMLDLDSNPGITDQGYGALLNLINQANVVGHVNARYREWSGLYVDDKAWMSKLNLVSEMNSDFRRLEYLTNGTFTSEERRWQWLERVADLPLPARELREEWDAKHLNFIWYTLCQNPEMMQVSQAPTWTGKRKAMRSTSPLSGAHSAKTQR